MSNWSWPDLRRRAREFACSIVDDIGRICLDCGKLKPDSPVDADVAPYLTNVCVCVTVRTGTDSANTPILLSWDLPQVPPTKMPM